MKKGFEPFRARTQDCWQGSSPPTRKQKAPCPSPWGEIPQLSPTAILGPCFQEIRERKKKKKKKNLKLGFPDAFQDCWNPCWFQLAKARPSGCPGKHCATRRKQRAMFQPSQQGARSSACESQISSSPSKRLALRWPTVSSMQMNKPQTRTRWFTK